jgi:hypothetical protein
VWELAHSRLNAIERMASGVLISAIVSTVGEVKPLLALFCYFRSTEKNDRHGTHRLHRNKPLLTVEVIGPFGRSFHHQRGASGF